MYTKQFIFEVLTLPSSGVRDNIAPCFLDNELIVLALVNSYPSYYEKISERLKQNLEIADIVFTLNSRQMENAPFEIKDNFDIALKALSGYGFCYGYISERLKKHPNIIKECLSSHFV